MKQDSISLGRALRGRQTPDESFKVQQKKLQSKNGLPSDLGLLEQTYIPGAPFPPLFKPLFSSPLLYLLYWRAKYRILSWAALLYLKFDSPRKTSKSKLLDRKITLHNKLVLPTALALHTEMYSAFASGSLPALRKLCADGLFHSFKSRIEARKQGEVVRWELVKYIGRPRVVSNKGGKVPIEGGAIQQAVVRIKSLQRMEREGMVSESVVEEFVVVQRKWVGWVVGKWEVWGTGESTDYNTLLKWVDPK